MGPVHLHLYAANGDISLLVPFPYGASYAATADGFTLSVDDYSYAEGAALLAFGHDASSNSSPRWAPISSISTSTPTRSTTARSADACVPTAER